MKICVVQDSISMLDVGIGVGLAVGTWWIANELNWNQLKTVECARCKETRQPSRKPKVHSSLSAKPIIHIYILFDWCLFYHFVNDGTFSKSFIVDKCQT